MKVTKAHLEEAVNGHIEMMADPDRVLDGIDFPVELMRALVNSMADVREVERCANSKRNAYRAGISDGLVLGVKIMLAQQGAVFCRVCSKPIHDTGNLDSQKAEALAAARREAAEHLGINEELLGGEAYVLCKTCANQVKMQMSAPLN